MVRFRRGKLKILSKNRLMTIEDITGEISEWTIEKISDNRYKVTGTRKTKDGTLIMSWESIATYLGEYKEEE